jgi:hypothetical protein
VAQDLLQHGEHKLIGLFALDVVGQFGGQEPGQRHGTVVMRFGRAQDESTADVGVRAAHVDPAIYGGFTRQAAGNSLMA